jgi:hypothetical protein
MSGVETNPTAATAAARRTTTETKRPNVLRRIGHLHTCSLGTRLLPSARMSPCTFHL